MYRHFGGNLFADLGRVVTEGSRGLDRRLDRQDEGSRIDFKKTSDYSQRLYSSR